MVTKLRRCGGDAARFNRAHVLSLCMFAGASLLMTSGCNDHRVVAQRLDRVAESVERYGFASVSTPFLASPVDEFQFDLKKSADEYFKLTDRTQGGARVLDSMAVDAQSKLKANIEEVYASIAKLAAAKSAMEFRQAQLKLKLADTAFSSLSDSNPALKANPDFNTLAGLTKAFAEFEEPDFSDLLPEGSDEMPGDSAPIDNTLRNALKAVGSLTKPLDMPEGNHGLNSGERIMLTHRDTTLQALLRWYMQPYGSKLTDYELYLCPVVVSVEPGWETRQGYVADVTVQVDLARSLGDRLEFLSSRYQRSSPPIQVAGVFPVMDANVYTLAASRRRLITAAAQLAMMGYGVQANNLLDFAKRDEFDVQTVSALPVATAYTAGPASYGFRVEPSVTAIGDFGGLNKVGGKELRSRSFPALAAVLVHQSYLRSKSGVRASELWDQQIGGDASPASSFEQPAQAAGVKIQEIYPNLNNPAAQKLRADKYDFLVFRTSVQWRRIDRPLGLVRDRRSELVDYEMAHQLDKARNTLKKLQKPGAAHAEMTLTQDVLASRWQSLRHAALDTQGLVRVWHSKPKSEVNVERVVPNFVCADRPTVLTIEGSGFEYNIRAVTVGGKLAKVLKIQPNSIVAVVPPLYEKPDSQKIVQGAITTIPDHPHTFASISPGGPAATDDDDFGDFRTGSGVHPFWGGALGDSDDQKIDEESLKIIEQMLNRMSSEGDQKQELQPMADCVPLRLAVSRAVTIRYSNDLAKQCADPDCTNQPNNTQLLTPTHGSTGNSGLICLRVVRCLPKSGGGDANKAKPAAKVVLSYDEKTGKPTKVEVPKDTDIQDAKTLLEQIQPALSAPGDDVKVNVSTQASSE